MLSASCSIETPAFTRRTLDWLSTSLLKGISREGLSLIFWMAFAMADSPRRAAEKLSLGLQPVATIRLSSHSPMRRNRSRGLDSSGRLPAHLDTGVDLVRKIGEQEIGSLRCRTCCAYDGAVIFAQHLQPGTDVVGVAHGRHDTD